MPSNVRDTMKVAAIVAFILILAIFASPVSAKEAEWWDDSYYYRIALGDSGSATVDFAHVMDELGICGHGDRDLAYANVADLDSMRLAAAGQSPEEISFEWSPMDSFLVDDYSSTIEKWSVGEKMAASVMDMDGSDALLFSKDTVALVKLFTSVNSDSFADMSYLSFSGKGNFRISVRDPAKGTFIVDENILLDEREFVALPLCFDAFRASRNYYVELYPLDVATFNWIDDLAFVGDVVSISYDGAKDAPFLYFNSVYTQTEAHTSAPSSLAGEDYGAAPGPAEGFRVSVAAPENGAVSGTISIDAEVHDSLSDIEWVRYRLDWPSWVAFEEYEYGIWGDMSFENGSWSAQFDTIGNVCDGHHSIVVMACDISGRRAIQSVDVDVSNISEGVRLSESEAFDFAVIGDTQPVAGGGIPNPLVATHIMKCVAEDDIDFIVQVGDLTYSGHLDEYVQLMDQIVGYATVPLYPAVGNHDSSASDGLDNFEYYFGNLMYSFDYGSSHFIFLCSELDGQKGLITGNQLVWLESELEEHSVYDNVFITVHQPIYPVFHGIENAGEVQELISGYDNVRAVFQGHEHTYFHDMVGDMHVFVTGGATWLDPQYPVENTFNHYFLISVDGDAMSWETVVPSYLFVESPAGEISTGESTVEVSGSTQPYTDIHIRDEVVQSDARGMFSAVVGLEYGINDIEVYTSGLPDGELRSETVTVVRQMPMEMELAFQDGTLVAKVASQGSPVEGAIVRVVGDEAATGPDGRAELLSLPDLKMLKVTASADGYVPVFGYIEQNGESGSFPLAYAGMVIVVVAVLVMAAYKRKN